MDTAAVDGSTARVISTIRTTTRPDHDSFVMLTARSKASSRYLYKLYSNVAELSLSNKWMTGVTLGYELKALSAKLKYFSHDFRYEGDSSLEAVFALQADRPEPFRDLKSFYVKDTLVIHRGKAGLIGEPINGEASFKPFDNQKGLDLFRLYIPLRDAYVELSETETETLMAQPALRLAMGNAYDHFVAAFGELNKAANRGQLLNDPAFGFLILSSLERRENDQWLKADIFNGPVFPQQQVLQTDDPAEALARCLNDIGKVELPYISKATGLNEAELVRRLERQVFLLPGTGEWVTTDAYLSGNVVAKLAVAEQAAKDAPDDLQLARSLAAIQRVQPEKIPFELLDFNLGERWIPMEHYKDFATELFQLDTRIEYFSSLDTFKVSYNAGNAITDEEYAVTPKQGYKMTAHSLLEHALENTSPHFTYTVGSGENMVRLPDNDAIQLAHRKIESMREKFIEWLRERPDAQKLELERLYNDIFNCYV
ncbi:MAG: DNA methylase, partial [Sphingobacteriales bacterium]